ncbi:MAG: hypothetical protein WBA68_06865, partial [Alteraurantiacibacter sp.]
MNSATLDINLRPLRIGFLVDPADRRVLSEVMRIATCLWGGLACPMIPVAEALPTEWVEDFPAAPSAGDLAAGLLRFFEPDILVETGAGQLNRIGASGRDTYEQHPDLELDGFIRTQGAGRSMRDLGLRVDHVYGHLYRKEFQFERRTPHKMLSFDGDDEVGRAFFEACYGLFPDRPDFAPIGAAYVEAFNAKPSPANVETWA